MFQQRQVKLRMPYASAENRTPDRAALGQLTAGTFAEFCFRAPHTRNVSADNYLRVGCHKICEKRAPAVAIAANVNKLGHTRFGLRGAPLFIEGIYKGWLPG